MHQLPSTGYLRLPQIIGQTEITEEQALNNKKLNAQAEAAARASGLTDKNGKPKFKRLPTRARPAIPAVIPVSKPTWFAGVRSGRYPAPVRTLGPQLVAWHVDDIMALVHRTAA